MKPKLIILNNAEDIQSVVDYLKDFDYVAYDTETTGKTKESEIIGISICAEESKAYYIINAYWKDDTLKYHLGVKEALIPLLNTLNTKSLIMHNGVFDCFMTSNYFNVSLINSLHTDTMILAHLLNENRKVGLKELSKSLFDDNADHEQKLMKESIVKNGGLVTKDQYELYKADPQLIAEYGAKDALLTFKLFNHLVVDLYDQGLDKFFYEDESMPLLRGATYELNTLGLKIDKQGLANLKKTLEAECLEAKAFIYKEITPYINEKYPGTNKKNMFNIGSSSQLSWLLFGKLELEFSNLTDGGKVVCRSLGLRNPYTKVDKRNFIFSCENALGHVLGGKKIRSVWSYTTCDKKTLTKLSNKYKWIERLLEYQRKKKILSTYVGGIEKRIRYGLIQPSFLQHGTTSGRYSSRNPNFQNLPRDDKRVKQCIVSRPGKSFVGSDFSQLEPRVFAYISGDERLLKAFNTTDDFYSVIGMEVYGKTDCVPKKDGHPNAFGIKYKKLRDSSKVIALASTYGATAHQLAPTTGKSIEDTQLDIDNYFDSFPKVKEMMLKAHESAKTEGRVLSIFGRPRRMPEAKNIVKLYGNQPHEDLPYEARNMLNLAVNHAIQSTGASICNRAMIKFVNDIKQLDLKECNILLQVHDEIVVECKDEDAETVSLLLQNAMETAVELPGIKLEAIPKIAKNLADLK